MPSDVPDVWRDEDGPSEAELERWASGELSQLTLDRRARRVVRLSLKTFWPSCSSADQAIIDRLLERLKATPR